MTGYEQTARIAQDVASDMKRGRKRYMAQIRNSRKVGNLPLDWVTLNHQIDYAWDNLTPEQLDRQASQLLAARGETQ